MNRNVKQVFEECHAAILKWREAAREPHWVSQFVAKREALRECLDASEKVFPIASRVGWPTWPAGVVRLNVVRWLDVNAEPVADADIARVLDDWFVWLLDLRHVGLRRRRGGQNRSDDAADYAKLTWLRTAVDEAIRKKEFTLTQAEMANRAGYKDPRSLRRGEPREEWMRYRQAAANQRRVRSVPDCEALGDSVRRGQRRPRRQIPRS